jgi:putative membrane protein
VTGVQTCALPIERYAKSGDNPKLKDWAGKTLPVLQHHLEMAENLKKRD